MLLPIAKLLICIHLTKDKASILAYSDSKGRENHRMTITI